MEWLYSDLMSTANETLKSYGNTVRDPQAFSEDSPVLGSHCVADPSVDSRNAVTAPYRVGTGQSSLLKRLMVLFQKGFPYGSCMQKTVAGIIQQTYVTGKSLNCVDESPLDMPTIGCLSLSSRI